MIARTSTNLQTLGPSSGYSLAVLRLRCNGIGDEGAEALAEAFMSLVTLHELDLGENQADDVQVITWSKQIVFVEM